MADPVCRRLFATPSGRPPGRLCNQFLYNWHLEQWLLTHTRFECHPCVLLRLPSLLLLAGRKASWASAELLAMGHDIYPCYLYNQPPTHSLPSNMHAIRHSKLCCRTASNVGSEDDDRLATSGSMQPGNCKLTSISPPSASANCNIGQCIQAPTSYIE